MGKRERERRGGRVSEGKGKGGGRREEVEERRVGKGMTRRERRGVEE